MGTNYYLYREPACKHCGHHGQEPLHIGKSSSGWCFSLHVLPEEGIASLEDWQRAWTAPAVSIEDEYGDAITPEQMLGIITHRSGRVAQHEPGYLAQNHAVDVPEGLLRHQMDGSHCIGHGDGTWDFITGTFC